MPFSLWLSLAAICAMGAMSPGPSLALVLRHTLGGGRTPGVVAALSHALGVGLYALLTVWGLGALIERFPSLFQAITWRVPPIWPGWASSLAGRAIGGAKRGRHGHLWHAAAREGMLVALANPKLILFFVALLSQFVTPDMSLAARAIIVCTAMLIDGGWYVLVAVGLSHSRVLPWLQARAHWINRATGVLLLALALRVAWAHRRLTSPIRRHGRVAWHSAWPRRRGGSRRSNAMQHGIALEAPHGHHIGEEDQVSAIVPPMEPASRLLMIQQKAALASRARMAMPRSMNMP